MSYDEPEIPRAIRNKAWKMANDLILKRTTVAEAVDAILALVPTDEPHLTCWFCTHPASTIGWGFAVCGQGDHAERARVLGDQRNQQVAW